MRPSLIKRLLVFCAVAAVALLLLPAAAAAGPVIEMIPAECDFGNVEVGSSATAIVTASNIGTLPLCISAIVFSDGSNADFALLTSPEMPCYVPPLNGMPHWLDLEITYMPSAAGYASATLKVVSNDPDAGLVTVVLSGTGVAATPSPTIADVLVFFDGSVANITLYGSGSGNSADGRLGALRNMIVMAGHYIDQGEYALAISQLEAVYQRCDGLPRPPDFAHGFAAPTLRGMVMDVIAALED